MNNSIMCTIKKTFFSILIFGTCASLFAMEEPKVMLQPSDVRVINLTNHDIILYPYKNKQALEATLQQKFAAKQDFSTLEDTQRSKVKNYNQADEWYASITTQEKKVFLGDKTPQAGTAINVTEIITQQLTQKPWLEGRPLFVVIRDESFLSPLGRALGYATLGLAITIMDVDPTDNDALKKAYENTTTIHDILNETGDTLTLLHYSYDQDGGIYRLKSQRKIEPRKTKLTKFAPSDKLYVTKYSDTNNFPLFGLPTNKNITNVTPLLLGYIEKQPYLDGAKLTITISSVNGDGYEMAVQAEEKGMINLPRNWYDISRLETRGNTQEDVIRFLMYNVNGQEVSSATLKKPKIALFFIPDYSTQLGTFWKISHPTMQALQQFAERLSANENLPVEVIIIKNNKELGTNAMRLANNIFNQLYRNSDLYKKIITIAERDGGNVASLSTQYLQRPIDVMYQLYTPTRQIPTGKTHQYIPNPENFKKLYNFYIDQGLGIQNWFANHIPNPSNITNYRELGTAWNQMWPLGSGDYLDESIQPGSIFNIATLYKGFDANAQSDSQIAPLLSHLSDITKIINDIYSINTNLEVAIDIQDPTLTGVYISIQKEQIPTDPNKQAIAALEKDYSDKQKQRLEIKFPASTLEKFADAAQNTYLVVGEWLGYSKQKASALYERTKGLLQAAKEQTPAALETLKGATQSTMEKLGRSAEWITGQLKRITPQMPTSSPQEEEIEMQPTQQELQRQEEESARAQKEFEELLAQQPVAAQVSEGKQESVTPQEQKEIEQLIQQDITSENKEESTLESLEQEIENSPQVLDLDLEQKRKDLARAQKDLERLTLNEKVKLSAFQKSESGTASYNRLQGELKAILGHKKNTEKRIIQLKTDIEKLEELKNK